MKIFIEKIGILFIPSIVWTTITAFGFGTQSLSNLIELAFIFVLSFLGMFIPKKWISWKYLVIFLAVFAVLARIFTPLIPE